MGTIVDTSKGKLVYIISAIMFAGRGCVSTWLLLLLLMMLDKSHAGTLRLEIDEDDEFCFYENFTKDIISNKHQVTYYVIGGGDIHNVVDLYMIHPKNGEIPIHKQKAKGKYGFLPVVGVYQFCLRNTGDWKLVEFDLVSNVKKTQNNKIGEKRTHVPTMMENYLEEISLSFEEIEEMQVEFRQHSSYGFMNAVNLNYEIGKWCTLQGILVVVTGFGQVFTVRRFFAEKKS